MHRRRGGPHLPTYPPRLPDKWPYLLGKKYETQHGARSTDRSAKPKGAVRTCSRFSKIDTVYKKCVLLVHRDGSSANVRLVACDDALFSSLSCPAASNLDDAHVRISQCACRLVCLRQGNVGKAGGTDACAVTSDKRRVRRVRPQAIILECSSWRRLWRSARKSAADSERRSLPET